MGYKSLLFLYIIECEKMREVLLFLIFSENLSKQKHKYYVSHG